MKERIPLNRLPAAGNVWQVTDKFGSSIVLIAYCLKPGLELLADETLSVRKHLSFNPNLTFWGKSERARISEIFVDRGGKVHMGFKNQPGMPIFYFTAAVAMPTKLLVAVLDDNGQMTKRFEIAYTSEKTVVTEFYDCIRDRFAKRKQISLRADRPGYMYLELFPQE